MQPTLPLDPSVIDHAPIDPEPADFTPDESDYYLQLVSELSADNADLRAELDSLKGKKTYEQVRADLMAPYATKVFRFLVAYCLAVTVFLVLQGFRAWGFSLPESVLAVLAGSTAAAAIGLVGFVVSGLFKSKSE